MELWFLVLFAINIGLAFIPANIASKKGYSFGGFWCLSFFLSFLVGLIVSAVLEEKHANGDAQIKYCTQCGASAPIGSTFCSACGAQISADIVSKTPQQNRFLTHYLGLAILGFMLLTALSLGTMSTHFFYPQNLTNVLSMLIPYALLALGVLISTRSKGIDFSLGAVMVLGAVIAASVAVQGSLVSGIIIGLLTCAVVGLTNGAVTVYLKLPSLIPTIAMAIILRWVNIAITNGKMIFINQHVQTFLPSGLPIGLVTVLPFAIIVVLVFISLSKLRKPMDELSADDMRKPVYMLSYMGGSILAGMGGIYIMLRIGAAVPAQSVSYVGFILLILGIIMSTRLTNKPIISVVLTLAAAIIYVLLFNATNLMMLDSFWQMTMTILFAILFFAISFFARKHTWKRMMQFK